MVESLDALALLDRHYHPLVARAAYRRAVAADLLDFRSSEIDVLAAARLVGATETYESHIAPVDPLADVRATRIARPWMIAGTAAVALRTGAFEVLQASVLVDEGGGVRFGPAPTPTAAAWPERFLLEQCAVIALAGPVCEGDRLDDDEGDVYRPEFSADVVAARTLIWMACQIDGDGHADDVACEMLELAIIARLRTMFRRDQFAASVGRIARALARQNVLRGADLAAVIAGGRDETNVLRRRSYLNKRKQREGFLLGA